MLDVAAVAERLLAPLSIEPARRDMLTAMVALHDLGKVSASFRDMIRKGHPQTTGRHWEVTELWLRDFDAALKDRLPERRRRRHHLYAAIAGHHGRPPSKDLANRDVRSAMCRAAGADAEVDARSCLNLVLDLWPDASLKGLSKAEVTALTWRLRCSPLSWRPWARDTPTAPVRYKT